MLLLLLLLYTVHGGPKHPLHVIGSKIFSSRCRENNFKRLRDDRSSGCEQISRSAFQCL
jgi:hypothetical protein